MSEKMMDSEIASYVLSDDERKMIGSEIERFALGSVAPLVERPELVLSQQKLNKLTEQAHEIGLLSLGGASGVGLWEQGDAPPLLSVQLLTSIAKVNAGVALHFHQFSLARFLLNGLALPAKNIKQTAISLTGYYGLGGAALPRYLLSREEAGDIDFLRGWLSGDNSTSFVFTASATWEKLLHPSIDSCGDLIFSLYSRQDLMIEEMPKSHGFDELATFCCQGFNDVEPLTVSSLTGKLTDDVTKNIYALALQYNALAYMAIALGAVQHAYKIASDYSAIREQGGAVINRHAAVQLLLGEQRSSIDSAEISVNHLGSKRLSLETLSTVFSIRSISHRKLCDAANAAMQSCGGIGYMQDTGLEKIVRDCNALRVMDGTPMELSLFTAEWERIHG
ncbi:MAG: acyl-CoA/acyl-ACP dehydrogenase [Pseudomonadales bacterium]|nr:acyl-CoA/acyl-ACP dehydrogenase [Pseudomonadales bacterium]